MYQDCIDFAVFIGNNFTEIPSSVIHMQQRFLNNDFYSVPFVAEIDVNFEKMTKKKNTI